MVINNTAYTSRYLSTPAYNTGPVTNALRTVYNLGYANTKKTCLKKGSRPAANSSERDLPDRHAI